LTQRRRTAFTVLLALTALACLPPAGAGAKPGYRKIPAFHVLQGSAHGTHGYQIAVTVLDGRPQLTAVSQAGADVSFVLYRQTKQRDTGDALDADFGKAGTIKARFVADKVEERGAPKGCVGGSTVAEIGTFVGSIAFHGAHGFTSFTAHRLKGAVTKSPGMVCRTRGRDRNSVGRSFFLSRQEGVLRVIAGVRSGATYFDAVTEPAEAGIPSTSTYTASSEHREGAVDILDTVEVPAPSPLAIPDLTASLPAATTIAPPAPFSGSATLEAPSRQTATLSGDLAVDLPATGEVPLSGPRIAAGLCRDYACSGSLPKALRPRRPSELGIGQVEIQTIN
jgi:hypothetical protein